MDATKMKLVDHYHFLIEELEDTRRLLRNALNRGGSKKRPGTALDPAQDIILQNVFKRRIDYVKSLLEAEKVIMDLIND